MPIKTRYIAIAVLLYLLSAVLVAPAGFSVNTAGDSQGYVDIATSIVSGERSDFTLRTPSYPLFLIPGVLFGSGTLIWIMQVGAGILAFLACYDMLARYLLRGRPDWQALCAALAVWGPVQIVGWSGYLLTEFLMACYLVIWIWLELRQRDNPSPASRIFWATCIFDIVFMMQRPAFMAWPILVYGMRLSGSIIHRWRTGTWRTGSQKVAVRFAWVVLVALVFCGYIYAETGYFEVSRLGRINALGVILNHGGLDERACDRRACDPVSQEALDIILNETSRSQIAHGYEGGISPRQLVSMLHGAHRDITRDEILDRVLRDFSAVTLTPRLRHYSGQLMLNLGNRSLEVGIPRYTPQFPEAYYAWSKASFLWEQILTLGLLGLLLGCRRMRDDPLLIMALGAWIYCALVAAVLAYGGYARMMAPALSMINLLGLYGLLETKRYWRSTS